MQDLQIESNYLTKLKNCEILPTLAMGNIEIQENANLGLDTYFH